MNRQTVEQYLIDAEVRDAARRVREHRPLGWSDYLVDVEHQVRHSELTTVVAMLALVALAAAVFWYGSPVPAVEAHLHQIVEKVVSR